MSAILCLADLLWSRTSVSSTSWAKMIGCWPWWLTAAQTNKQPRQMRVSFNTCLWLLCFDIMTCVANVFEDRRYRGLKCSHPLIYTNLICSCAQDLRIYTNTRRQQADKEAASQETVIRMNEPFALCSTQSRKIYKHLFPEIITWINCNISAALQEKKRGKGKANIFCL